MTFEKCFNINFQICIRITQSFVGLARWIPWVIFICCWLRDIKRNNNGVFCFIFKTLWARTIKIDMMPDYYYLIWSFTEMRKINQMFDMSRNKMNKKKKWIKPIKSPLSIASGQLYSFYRKLFHWICNMQ